MKKTNSTVVLNCQSRLVDNYLSKGLFIIEKDCTQLSIFLNDGELRIHVIDQLETDFSWKKRQQFPL